MFDEIKICLLPKRFSRILVTSEQFSSHKDIPEIAERACPFKYDFK